MHSLALVMTPILIYMLVFSLSSLSLFLASVSSLVTLYVSVSASLSMPLLAFMMMSGLMLTPTLILM